MSGKRIAVVLCIFVCSAGMAMGQTEWVDHPESPVIEQGPPGSWNEGGHGDGSVIFDGSIYHMWLSGFDQDGDPTDIGHATSADGVDWTMDPANPVVTRGELGEWDGDLLFAATVVYDGTQFQMWYGGDNGQIQRTGYATSPDGSVWTKYVDNPVLEVGPPGSWDDWIVRPGTVALSDETYKMWYSGHTHSASGIGYAESVDGIDWIKRPLPVLEPGTTIGAWDVDWIAHFTVLVTVLVDEPTYHMWYTGGGDTARIGYAYSDDGISWAKHRYNPIIQIDGAWSGSPKVVSGGSTFHMWYTDWDEEIIDWIRYATSDCCPGVAGLSHAQYIPAAAVASGAEGSFYQTDVDLNNAGSQPVDYEFKWLPRGEDCSDPTTSDVFSLGADMSVRYTNVLSEVFGLEPNSLGALSLVSSSPDLLAMSRTYNNPAGDDEGTFGQAIPAVAPGDFIQTGERRRILFASETDDLRFNVGCQNDSGEVTAVSVELFDGEGTSLERTMMVLPAWANDQLNRVFENYMPVNGYVDVWTVQSGRSFTCYGSVLDNVTSDPTTILPQ